MDAGPARYSEEQDCYSAMTVGRSDSVDERGRGFPGPFRRKRICPETAGD